MSRKVETDFEFDKDKFAKLLQKAKGELMLKSFAEKCDVSVGYMCKCFNAKLNHPLTPATLKKISIYSEEQGVSYRELLNACGYEADKYIAKYDSEIIKNADLIKFKTMTIAELGISILNKLHKEKNKDAAVTIINITENSIHDFASIGNFIVERYDEEQYVDVISILQSEGKIMAITKNHYKLQKKWLSEKSFSHFFFSIKYGILYLYFYQTLEIA